MSVEEQFFIQRVFRFSEQGSAKDLTVKKLDELLVDEFSKLGDQSQLKYLTQSYNRLCTEIEQIQLPKCPPAKVKVVQSSQEQVKSVIINYAFLMINNPGLFGNPEGPLELLNIMIKNELNAQIDYEYIGLFVDKCLAEQKENNEPILRNLFLPIFLHIKEQIEGTSFPIYPTDEVRVLILLTQNSALMSLFSLEPGLLFIPFPNNSPYCTSQLNPLAHASTSDGALHFSLDMSSNSPTLFLSLLSKTTIEPEAKFFSSMHIYFSKTNISATEQLIDYNNSNSFTLNNDTVRTLAQIYSYQELEDSPLEVREVIQRSERHGDKMSLLHEQLKQLMLNIFRVTQPPSGICHIGLLKQQSQIKKPESLTIEQIKDGTFIFDPTISLAQNLLNFLECFCVHNNERTKQVSSAILSSTDGFVMNLCGALLRVCEPFLTIPKIDLQQQQQFDSLSATDSPIKTNSNSQSNSNNNSNKGISVSYGNRSGITMIAPRSVMDYEIYSGGIRESWIQGNNNSNSDIAGNSASASVSIPRSVVREVIYGRTNQNVIRGINQNQIQSQSQLKSGQISPINQIAKFDSKKWRGLQGATEAELQSNKLLNKIELHFAMYSTQHSLAQQEPRISLRSGIQIVEPNLKELISQKTGQEFPFKFQRVTENMYLTIHALHVGLIPALNKYKQLVRNQNEEFNHLPPALLQMTISPFPSVLTSQFDFEEFIKYISERAEIQQNKKLAHLALIDENDFNKANQLVNKPLISTKFNYQTPVSGIYSTAIHRLHPLFRDMPPANVRNMLNIIRTPKQVIEQVRGYDSVVAFSDLLERCTKFYDFVAWLYLRQFGEINGYGNEKDGQIDDDIGFWDYEQYQFMKEKEKDQVNSNNNKSNNIVSQSPIRNPTSTSTSTSTSTTRDPVSSSSAAITSPFLLRHPLIAIQPLFILEDMTSLMHKLQINRTTLNYLKHAKNILHLMAFFVLNFRMISHQQTVIEIGEMLS
ncbi:MAG: hypothetical protein EZS28_007225, partial [Streblomastix strix]